ncbi:MAG: co-chaperone GroES [Planctomycetes bacterium]|nr:co-chaperone GroES [Planctomycetota bacterium]NOG55745.1 co-chaperone GroES [Planctomycetota bacterium]
MKVRPLGDKILVKRDDKVEKTESGLYLPESAKDTPKTGTVESIGQGRLNKDTGEYSPFTVKRGDRVLFSSYAGTEVKINDSELLIMSEEEILAVIED